MIMDKPLSEIVDWIIKNRKGNAFKDYSKEKIECELYESIFFCIFRLALDHDGNIIGVVCGNRDINKKQIYVHDILSTKEGIVQMFLNDCHKCYPDYQLLGMAKNERPRVFSNAKQLSTKIERS